METSFLLPLRLRPCDDEIFSCWMVRVAAAYNLKARSLCHLLTGKRTEFGSDYDVSPDKDLFHALAVRSGLDPVALRSKHTLVGWIGLLYPNLIRGQGAAWILPSGTFYALRPALQYCPLCLHEPTPYFRRIWRLSLFNICPVHGAVLCHTCPACSAATNPIKNDLRWGGGAICRCWNCGKSLRNAPVVPANERDVRIASELSLALRTGVKPSDAPQGIDLTAYLGGLALICSKLLRRQPRLEQWKQIAAQAAGVSVLPAPAGRRASTNFNSLVDPIQRQDVLRTATFLLQNWPEQFLEIARSGNTRTSDFASHFAAAPGWFLKPLQDRLTPARAKPVPSPGLLKVRRMKELILEHRRDWSPTKLPRLIRALRAAGFYSVNTEDSIIMRSLPNVIARLRFEGADYRKRQTIQVTRGTSDWSKLLICAKPYRKTHCKSTEILRRGIKLLCRERFLSSADLGELLHRSHKALLGEYLRPMVRAGELQTKFGVNRGGALNYPGQAYRTTPLSPSHC